MARGSCVEALGCNSLHSATTSSVNRYGFTSATCLAHSIMHCHQCGSACRSARSIPSCLPYSPLSITHLLENRLYRISHISDEINDRPWKPDDRFLTRQAKVQPAIAMADDQRAKMRITGGV